jgi:hypothetical protein
MGGECGLLPEIRATSVPIDDPVPRRGPIPITFGTNAGGRPPVSPCSAGLRRYFWAKKGQGSQGTESPVLPAATGCRLCLIACNTRQIDEVRFSGSGRGRPRQIVLRGPGLR